MWLTATSMDLLISMEESYIIANKEYLLSNNELQKKMIPLSPSTYYFYF